MKILDLMVFLLIIAVLLFCNIKQFQILSVFKDTVNLRLHDQEHILSQLYGTLDENIVLRDQLMPSAFKGIEKKKNKMVFNAGEEEAVYLINQVQIMDPKPAH